MPLNHAPATESRTAETVRCESLLAASTTRASTCSYDHTHQQQPVRWHICVSALELSSFRAKEGGRRWQVTVASVERKPEVTCSRGVRLVADGLIGDYKGVLFDAISLPGQSPIHQAVFHTVYGSGQWPPASAGCVTSDVFILPSCARPSHASDTYISCLFLFLFLWRK